MYTSSQTKGKRPNFFVIGAAKAGTTSLCALLGQHPDICMSDPKEPHFFSSDENYKKGMEWYGNFFKNINSQRMIGEGSVSYTNRTQWPDVAERIRKVAPDAKFLYLVRHPLERIVSHWRMFAREDLHVPEFNKAIFDSRLTHHLLDRSKYWFQISAYREHFPDSSILVLFFEDFIENPEAIAKSCFRFLDVEMDIELKEALPALNVAAKKGGPDRYFAKLLRFTGILDRWRDMIPDRLWKSAAKSRLFKGQKDDGPVWDDNVRKWIVEQLYEDTRKFLKFYGKPDDYWNFD